MKFSADILPLTTKPLGLPWMTIEVEGNDARAAARMAAFKVARKFYPGLGEPSSVHQRKDGSFQASIGVYKFENGYGVTKGITIIIKLTEQL